MRPAREKRPAEPRGAGRHCSQTLLDRIGSTRLLVAIWRSIPLPLRLIAFPYDIIVYRRFLATCDNLAQLRSEHSDKCDRSRLFRLLRPRYHKLIALLSRIENDRKRSSAN